METGQILGPLNGIVTAIADELWALSGNAMTRTTAAAAAGAVTLNVEQGYLVMDDAPTFPAADGRIAVDGQILRYATATATTFTGVTDDDGNVGIPNAIRVRTAVMDISRLSSQMDDLRASFLLPTADGNELDIFARNYGLARVRGLTDTQLRAYLQAAIYLEAQTIYGIEQVLDAIVGVGNYTVYEDLETTMHTVYVSLVPVNGGPEGRSYFCGLEGPVARSTLTTVAADNPPNVIYGVWASTDPVRLGTNYAHKPITSSLTNASPTRLSSAALFVAGDLGKPILLTRASGNVEAWRVDTFVSTSAVTLATRSRTNGRAATATPDHFFAAYGAFPTWCVGHTLEILSGVNIGTYTIASRVSGSELTFSSGALTTESDIEWRLVPKWGGVEAGLTAKFLRATAVGNTITTPVNMPATVYLDYTSISSMELMAGVDVDGNAASPFYLWDEGAIVQTILDLITAAGIRVIVRTQT